ncbi:hypothetical protein PV721_36830 [Streptomyces sp. MB09-01]|uniref:hypothetical protein n=1 Tax=Streptomyces sp. MB09-01 TaxID=3028666 RepID=UPI0029BD6343|nr:hypothetical protein [Streptomyces sp. MB09-01]MDX3539792.1 hypothetical protein [Streptomyces sp. MB09-01]
MTRSPHHLVAAAGDLLTPPPGTEPTLTPALRARAAAALLRLALDEAMDDFWRGVSPRMVHARGRTKALCLDAYVSPALARQWYAVWRALTAAGHHHTYEPPPTPAEVKAWHGAVTDLLHAMPTFTGP